MVHSLNLPLDYDDLSHVRTHTPNREDVLTVEQKEHAEKSRLDEEGTVTVTSACLESSQSNKLRQAKEALQHIIRIENKIFFEEDKNEVKKYDDNSVMPLNVDSETINRYKDAKDKFRSLVQDLLKTRSHYTKHIAHRNSKTDLVNEEENDINSIVKTTASQRNYEFNFFIELRKPYYKLFLVITIFSMVAFGIMALIVSAYDYYDYIGPWIMVSRA